MRPQFYAARARPCAAGNARKFCLPPDDAQQLPRDFHRHPERRDDQVCRELHARDPHQSKRPEDVKALIKTAEKNGYKMGLFLQAQNGWAPRCRGNRKADRLLQRHVRSLARRRRFAARHRMETVPHAELRRDEKVHEERPHHRRPQHLRPQRTRRSRIRVQRYRVLVGFFSELFFDQGY